jgi:hypothetical protein
MMQTVHDYIRQTIEDRFIMALFPAGTGKTDIQTPLMDRVIPVRRES